MSGRQKLETVMLTVKAEIIDVFIGSEERLHKMALYSIGTTKLAMFVCRDTTGTMWQPDKLPDEFDDPVFRGEFTADLAEMGYILETKMYTKQ